MLVLIDSFIQQISLQIHAAQCMSAWVCVEAACRPHPSCSTNMLALLSLGVTVSHSPAQLSSNVSSGVLQYWHWCSVILTIFRECAYWCILEAMKTLSWKGILSNTLSTPATATLIRKTLNGARLFLQRLPIDEMCTPMQIDVTVGEHYCHCVQCKEHVGAEITGR